MTERLTHTILLYQVHCYTYCLYRDWIRNVVDEAENHFEIFTDYMFPSKYFPFTLTLREILHLREGRRQRSW